jgi:hypothetical protein
LGGSSELQQRKKRNWSRNIVQEHEIVSQTAQYEGKKINKTVSYALRRNAKETRMKNVH